MRSSQCRIRRPEHISWKGVWPGFRPWIPSRGCPMLPALPGSVGNPWIRFSNTRQHPIRMLTLPALRSPSEGRPRSGSKGHSALILCFLLHFCGRFRPSTFEFERSPPVHFFLASWLDVCYTFFG